jgi:hypothetical protein
MISTIGVTLISDWKPPPPPNAIPITQSPSTVHDEKSFVCR